MQMIVDAALITKKAPDAEFNTDSLNASGKVWPREIVHSNSGIKAAGKSQGRPYYVLSSAEMKGTAESAADLFRQCLPEFDADGSNYSMVLSDYFKAFAKVLNKSGFDSSACDQCIFTGFGDSVYLAKSGNAKMFRYADGKLTEAVPQMFRYIDNAAAYGVCSYESVKPGEVYVLVSGSVASVVSESLFRAICNNAGGDIKKIVALIASNAVKNGCTQAVSAVAIRIEEPDMTGDPEAAAEENNEPERENPYLAEVSAFAAHEAAPAERVDYDNEPEPVSEKDETEKRFKLPFGSGRVAFFNIAIVAVVLIVALGLIIGKGILGKKKPGSDVVLPTNADETTETTTQEESTTAAAPESTTAAQRETSTTARSGESVTSSTIRNRNEPSTNRTTPATEPPVTQSPPPPPTTQPPLTEPPVTEPPVTEPPVTEPPVTEPEPITDAPATEPEPPSSESETVDQIPDEFL